MDELFTQTVVNLTPEYVNLFTSYELSTKLSKVKELTGVKTSKAKNKYTLLGSWEQVNNAFEFLQKWHDNPSEEPVGKDVVIEIRQDELTGQYKPQAQDNEASNVQGPNLNNQTESRKACNEIIDNDDDCEDHINDSSVVDESKVEQNIDHKETQSSKIDNKNNENSDNLSISKSSNKSIISENKKSVNKKSKAKKNSTKIALSEVKDPQKQDENSKQLLVESNYSEHNGILPRNSSSPVPQSVTDIVKFDDTNNDSSKENKLEIDANEREDKDDTKSGKRNTRKPGDKGYWSRVKIDNYNEKHKCPKCDVVLKSRKRFMEHMRRIHIKDYKCDICERRFGYPTDLHRHKCAGVPDPNNVNKRKAGRPKKEKIPIFIPCTECDYIGTSKKRFNGHVKRSHRLQFSCDQCKKRFGFARDLQRHKDNVHAEISHSCEKCSKSYKSKSIFDEHMKTHEEGYVKPKFLCKVCEKSFTTRYALSSHIKTEHLGVKKTYLCQICGKKFSQRNSYKQHSNAHAGIKPYKCDICSAAFTYHKSLKEHKFMHDSIRRFQCQLCEKAFRQKTTLQIHMKVHKAIKDHICKTCGKGFAQKQAMERHERIHSGIKPYTCIPCQRTFGDASTIRRHMFTIHQKDETNWKEDVICSVKKKTDYYVLGGSGQNRTYNSKSSKKQTDQVQKIKSESAKSKQQPEIQTTEQQLFLVNTQEQCNEYSLSELTTLQDQTGQFHTLQPGAIFAVPTSLAQGSLQNVGSPLTLNCNNGGTQILDYSTLTQTLQSQLLGEKKPDSYGNQYELQPPCNQQSTLIQTSSESQCLQQLNGAQTSAQDNTSSLGQNLNNLWGFVGYQPYFNTATASGQFNTQQNQQ